MNFKSKSKLLETKIYLLKKFITNKKKTIVGVNMPPPPCKKRLTSLKNSLKSSKAEVFATLFLSLSL